MHPDILRLINVAKEAGEITEKHKAIILRKAEKLGEDVDEVEIYLESIINQNTSLKHNDYQSERRKCPNCGATISGYSLQCPECGYIFHIESKATTTARDYIKSLSEELLSIENRLDLDQAEKDSIKATAINAFTVPNTVEALVQLFSISYSNYVSEKEIINSLLAPVWLGKAKSSYLLLKSQPYIDGKTQQLISNYSFIENLTISERIQKREKEKYEIVKEKEETNRYVAMQQKEQSSEKWLYIMCAIIMLAIVLAIIFTE